MANCPSQPPNSVPAPILAPEHMVLLAPLAPIHVLFKSKFQSQAKNIRSRKPEEQQLQLQICFLFCTPSLQDFSCQQATMLQDTRGMG